MRHCLRNYRNQIPTESPKRNFWGLVMHGYEILHGGDLNENGNCKEGSLVMHGYTFLHGSELNEDIIIRGGN